MGFAAVLVSALILIFFNAPAMAQTGEIALAQTVTSYGSLGLLAWLIIHYTKFQRPKEFELEEKRIAANIALAVATQRQADSYIALTASLDTLATLVQGMAEKVDRCPAHS